jgi:hypothetical protein
MLVDKFCHWEFLHQIFLNFLKKNPQFFFGAYFFLLKNNRIFFFFFLCISLWAPGKNHQIFPEDIKKTKKNSGVKFSLAIFASYKVPLWHVPRTTYFSYTCACNAILLEECRESTLGIV